MTLLVQHMRVLIFFTVTPLEDGGLCGCDIAMALVSMCHAPKSPRFLYWAASIVAVS